MYLFDLLFRSLVHGSSESSMIKKRNSGSGIKSNEEVQDTNNDWDCDGGDDNDFSLLGDDFDPHTAQGVNINYRLLLSIFIVDFSFFHLLSNLNYCFNLFHKKLA